MNTPITYTFPEDVAESAVANNTPLSELSGNVCAFDQILNEDSTPINVETQTISVDDIPDLAEWYYNVELRFIPAH